MYLIAYDLGTGGVKASLYDEQMNTIAKSFIAYPTTYPKSYMHEQRPEDWWHGVVESTKILVQKSSIDSNEIKALALSGHSLVTVPIDQHGNLLTEQVPIWSDTRAVKETDEFFQKIDEKNLVYDYGKRISSTLLFSFQADVDEEKPTRHFFQNI